MREKSRYELTYEDYEEYPPSPSYHSYLFMREKSRYELAYEDYEEYPETPAVEEETSPKPDDRKVQNTSLKKMSST